MQQRLPVPATAIRDTMAAVFRQAPYLKRQPSWLARKIGEFLAWLADRLHWAFGSRESNPVIFWVVLSIIVAIAVAITSRLAWVSWLRRKQGIAARPLSGAPAIGFGRDPWSMAQQHAAQGDFTAAAHALYAALLSAIARRGFVRLHPSKTVGDYVRELRTRSAPAFGGFREFARAYEYVIYGAGECDRERWERLRALAIPIVQVDG